jgi:ABC-2 type transport system permease protein
MTYASERMRSARVPDVPHIQPWISLVVLAGSIVVLSLVGVRGFYRRAID